MEKIIKFFKKNFEKVNVQVSLLTCALIVISCCIIFFVTSEIMMSLLKAAYAERTDLTFTTIESHLDNRLYQENMPKSAHAAVKSYLSAVKGNMAISEIFIVRKNSNGDIIYVLDTQSETDENLNRDINVTGKISDEISRIYNTGFKPEGSLYRTENGIRYISFYPVKSDARNVKGVIGIDINVSNIYIVQFVMRIAVIIIILLCCIISIRFSNRIFRKISNPLYQDASNTDSLTGLKNKNSFTVDLHNIEEGSTERYSVVTIDLNGLKSINDTRGHQTGDYYIQRAGKVLKSAMQGTEYIGYRVGGDEFTVILKDVSLEDIKAFVRKIESVVEEFNKSSGLVISMSIGYAKFDSEKDRNFSMTIERSDAMMYENKRMFYKKKSLNR